MADFSIITPVLNQVSTIQTCIDSVASQNVNVEHIIIDGGSTDGTVEVIRANQDKLTYWISESDLGQSNAINKGLNKANGTWFNWLNSDDKLSPNALQTVIQLAKDETQVVAGKCEHVDTEGNVIESGTARIWESTEATLGNYSMGQPSVFYRTKFVEELGGLNEELHLCLDMDLWFRFLCKNGIQNIVSTDKTFSQFLIHKYSKSSLHTKQMRSDKYGIYKALLEEMDLNDALKEFFTHYDIPPGVSYDTVYLKMNEVVSNFAWHLLVDAYGEKDFDRVNSLLKTVSKGSRLSFREKLTWESRLMATRILKK